MNIKKLNEALERILEDTLGYSNFKYVKEIQDKLYKKLQNLELTEIQNITYLSNNSIELQLKPNIYVRFYIDTKSSSNKDDSLFRYDTYLSLFDRKRTPQEIIDVLNNNLTEYSKEFVLFTKDFSKEDMDSDVVNIIVDGCIDNLIKIFTAISQLEGEYYTYFPYQVINKDNGDVWEFDSLQKAKEKQNELMDNDFYGDIRVAKVSQSGDILKWL